MFKGIKIKDRFIGNGKKTFIIAEAGSNHGGSLEQAKELIDVASESGADAIKFQSYEADLLIGKNEPAYKVLDKYALPYNWHLELNRYCNQKNILFCSTPFDEEKLEWLEELGVSFYKIASGDLTYLPFIEKIAEKNKPIILSTGMANLGEVEEAVSTILKTGNKQIIILHCVGRYPTKSEESNLKVLKTLKQAFGFPVGFSDHTESTIIPACAVSMGAEVIEKHFTLDKELDTPDHSFALRPIELKEMVKYIRIAEAIKGSGFKNPTQSERETSLINARRSIHAKKPIKKGETITKDKIKLIRPANGLPPKYLAQVIGKKTGKYLDIDDPINFDILEW